MLPAIVTCQVARPSAAEVDDQEPVKKLLLCVIVIVSVADALDRFVYAIVKLHVEGTVMAPVVSRNSTQKFAAFPASILTGPLL